MEFADHKMAPRPQNSPTWTNNAKLSPKMLFSDELKLVNARGYFALFLTT